MGIARLPQFRIYADAWYWILVRRERLFPVRKV
jgi:hypothetical protein